MVTRENIQKIGKWAGRELARSLLFSIIAGITAGLIVWGASAGGDSRKKEASLLQIDKYNLGVACLLQKGLRLGNLLALKYDTQVYKENSDFINDQYGLLQEKILLNIAYMEASNTMVNLLYQDRTNLKLAKNVELARNILLNAEKIFKNITEYDSKVADIKCL